ncbi:uncharacterized protein LOC133203520 [Saccostrea echinata]|uniref:uncharacterized protein LOC133203520 n=1 Tax=Saccostrea echinata TaxID=191078 RepID=UPI002A82BAA1|nr:uncharacterized protein LOC133203520 [Saccostrea echinata]
MNNSIYDEEKTCVEFTLDLTTPTTNSVNVSHTLQKRHCSISDCIIEWIMVTCTFPQNKNHEREIGSTNIDTESGHRGFYQINLLLALASGTAGCIMGVIFTIAGHCFKIKLQSFITQSTTVSTSQDHSVFRESINNLHMYSDIEDTARISEKAIQVPSIKDKSPSSMRSRTSNVYHLLSEKGSPVESVNSIRESNSPKFSTSGDSIHNKSWRRKDSTTSINFMEQDFETGNADSNDYFELEKNPTDPRNIL